LVRHDGSVEPLHGTGLILGILPSAQYEQQTCRLEPGDLVVLFSDGVTEACRPDVDEEFGEERLAKTLAKLNDAPAQSIIEATNRILQEFTGGAPPADDITLVVAKRAASPSAVITSQIQR
jgi:sigma-B regulation protein RsbU (phosphoserine phosphatase)